MVTLARTRFNEEASERITSLIRRRSRSRRTSTSEEQRTPTPEEQRTLTLEEQKTPIPEEQRTLTSEEQRTLRSERHRAPRPRNHRQIVRRNLRPRAVPQAASPPTMAQPRIVKLPEDFYGKKNEDRAEWIQNYIRIIVANRWDDVRKLAIISLYLKGIAARWYDQWHVAYIAQEWLGAAPTFVESFKDRFQNKFQMNSYEEQ